MLRFEKIGGTDLDRKHYTVGGDLFFELGVQADSGDGRLSVLLQIQDAAGINNCKVCGDSAKEIYISQIPQSSSRDTGGFCGKVWVRWECG